MLRTYISRCPKPQGNRDSLTIVMMSDLHIGEVIGKDLVQKYVALSNAQHPDMVVLAGDIMDYESRFAENAHIEDDLKQLKAPLGVYIIYGNHEYRANRKREISLVAKDRRYATNRLGGPTGLNFLFDREG